MSNDVFFARWNVSANDATHWATYWVEPELSVNEICFKHLSVPFHSEMQFQFIHFGLDSFVYSFFFSRKKHHSRWASFASTSPSFSSTELNLDPLSSLWGSDIVCVCATCIWLSISPPLAHNLNLVSHSVLPLTIIYLVDFVLNFRRCAATFYGWHIFIVPSSTNANVNILQFSYCFFSYSSFLSDRRSKKVPTWSLFLFLVGNVP